MTEPQPRNSAPFASENPYQSPTAYGGRVEVISARIVSNDPEHLRRVAIYQKGVLLAIALYILNMIFQLSMAFANWRPPAPVAVVFMIIGIVAWLSCLVAVGLLAAKLHGAVVGVLMLMLSFVPCANFIILLIINHQATRLLMNNGVHVGLLGARMSDLPAREIT